MAKRLSLRRVGSKAPALHIKVEYLNMESGSFPSSCDEAGRFAEQPAKHATGNGADGGMLVEPIGTKDKNDALAFAKGQTNNSEYTEQLEFTTSSKMDDKIYNSAKNKQKKVNANTEKYNPTTNSCADAVKQVIQEGTGVKLPSKIDPRPNSYFKELKENKNAIQIKINVNATTEQLIQEAKSTLKNMQN